MTKRTKDASAKDTPAQPTQIELPQLPRLKPKHPYAEDGPAGDRKRHGVPEYELAMVHQMLRATKAKTLRAFLDDEVSPLWDRDAEGPYSREKATIVFRRWIAAFTKDGLIE